MKLSLFSEPYRPVGNIDGRATRRALTQPAGLDLYDLLLRETLQNSWDARADPDGPIDFHVDAVVFDDHQLEVLASTVFADLPPTEALDEDFDPREIGVALVITDRGTNGLRGPTRADRAQTGEDDFVDFVRNIGRATDKALGGGTFGFGKGVLYEASFDSTVILYSRTSEAGEAVSRLMAIRLGDSYSVKGRRYTGRHWWGVLDDTTGCEPLTGDDADELATTLGINRLGVDESGTAFMVVSPKVHNDESLAQVTQRIADAALLWAWPHAIDGPNGTATIRFHIEGPAGPVAVPHPATHPELQDFAAAFTRSLAVLGGGNASMDWPWTDQEIRSLKPRMSLGALSFRRQLPRQEFTERKSLGDGTTSHTVALMRDPHLVVKYFNAPPDPARRTVAGVFIAAPELNDQYAMAEPVAHDDWVASNVKVERNKTNPVKVALERIRDVLKTDRVDVAIEGGAAASAGLVSLASTLGRVLDGHFGGTDPRIASPSTDGRGTSTGTSGGASGDGGGSGTGRRGPKTSRIPAGPHLDGQPALRRYPGGVAAVFPVSLPDRSEPVRLRASPRVLLDGTTEKPDDAPVGAARPDVIGWSIDELGEQLTDNSATGVFTVPPDVDRVHVWVRQPVDTAVTLVVALLEGTMA